MAINNTAKYKIVTQYFSGGVSIDPKLAVANSFYKSQNLDFRSVPSQISSLPGSTELANNLDDLITAMQQDLNGVRWGVGNKGGIYRINTSNVVSKEAQMTEDGSAGMLYNQVTDQLYIPGETSVSMYGKVTGTPVFRDKQFDYSASQANGCVNLWNPATGFYDGIVGVRNNAASIVLEGITTSTQVTTYSTQTYTTPLVLSEAAGQYCFFAPDIEPFYSIDVYVVNKGTGNWTLTLHDSQNNTLAQVTVNNASINNNAYNRFLFTGPIRAIVNASQTGVNAAYHWHITSTVADGTVGTITAADLSTADFLLYAYRLVPTENGWHPTALFNVAGVPVMAIGNGQYLSTYNFGNDLKPTNSQWVRHQLYFKPGFEVCGMTTNNQYLVIAAERRSKNANRVAQEGVLYFWDGSTNAPNMIIDIPMGSPYGLFTFNNVTYFTVAGSLFAWSGGQTVIKVRKLVYQNTDYFGTNDQTIINPNMFTSRYNLLMMGYPSITNNPDIHYGVKSWGTVELTFPNSFGDSYELSNNKIYNNTGGVTNLQIGCVYNFLDTMYMSWTYTQGGIDYYGIDILDNTSPPTDNFRWESLIYDGGARYKQKKALRLKITFLPLPADTTVTAMFNLNRSGWVDADPTGGALYSVTQNSTSILVEFNNARYYEIQYGFYGTTVGATQPAVITSVTFETDPLTDEPSLRGDII